MKKNPIYMLCDIRQVNAGGLRYTLISDESCYSYLKIYAGVKPHIMSPRSPSWRWKDNPATRKP